MRDEFLAALSVFVLSTAGLTTGAAADGNWAQFGYDPGHGGYNPGETIIKSGNVASLSHTGTLATPGEIADPVMISGGIAYVNSIGANALYAFDVATGQQLWSFSGANLDSARGIAVKGDRVFVTCELDSQHSGLCALKARTGKLLWSWAYEAYASSPQSPPAVSGDVVYVEEFQTYGDWLTALDTKTGAVLWQFGYCQDDGVCDALGQNVPAIDNGMVYLGCSLVSGLQGVCAVNASSGALAWATQLGGEPNGNGYSWGDASGNLIAHKGVVYANYMTMNCNQCSYTVDVVALDEPTGTSIWDTPIQPLGNSGYGAVGPPAIHGGQIISVLECCAVDNDSGLVSLNSKTGEVQWDTETGIWLSSSPSLVNDLAFVECSHGGAVGTLCAFDTKNGAYLWNSPDQGFAGLEAPPITGGVAYEICGYNDVCLYAP